MKAVDICRKPAVTAAAATSIVEVASLMRANHVGSVVVVSDNGERKPMGIVTDRDIVVEVIALGLDAATMTAGDIMSRSPVVSEADADVLWALKVMRDRGVRRLPVVDNDGTLYGIIALDDLLEAAAGSLQDVVQTIGTERLIESVKRKAA